MSTKRINLGVIGVGRIGRIHAEHIATRVRGARLAAIADLNPGAARQVAERFQVPLVTADYHQLLEERGVQAVTICSPTDTHAQIIEEAAASKKQIFCEKPIDLDLERIEQALATVNKAGVKLQIGFNRRFDPSFAKARELIASGQLGGVHLVRITSRDPSPPPLEYARGSGGLFLDMTVHDFDMVRFLTGSEVVEVFATGAALIDPALKRFGDVDTSLVTLWLRNGALATIDNSRQAVYGYDQRIEVFGPGGMVMVDNRKPDSHICLDPEGAHAAGPQDLLVERYQEALLSELQSFVDCLRLDRPPAVTGLDGLAAAAIGLAAKKSLQEHRPVLVSEVCRSCSVCGDGSWRRPHG